MTLREACEHAGIDDDPLGCAFLVAGFLRSSLQGEPSTFEGECASLRVASEHYDLTTGAGVRAWLADLGRVPDIDAPAAFWRRLADAAEADRAGEGDDGGDDADGWDEFLDELGPDRFRDAE